jgi:hypothetical protein
MSEAILEALRVEYPLNNSRLHREVRLQQLPNKSYLSKTAPRSTISNPLVEAIRSMRSTARIDSSGLETADAAMNDAIQLVSRQHLRGTPRIMFARDGILTIQWQRENYGVALVFAGDSEASIAFRRPGQLYAENGLEVSVQSELPAVFAARMAEVL